jgi:predicted enzyme related to lactoylglutathione lyase
VAIKTNYDKGTFSWVDLASHDMDAAQEFYGKVFGWTCEAMDVEGGPRYGEFRLEGRTAAGLGEMNDEMKSHGVPPMWNSYITVQNIEAVTAKAAELGGSITVPAMKVFEAGSLSFIQDPTGGNVGLWQPNQKAGAAVVNEPGSFCWNELATRDIEKAREFYGKLLGWEYEEHAGAPTTYYIIKNNGNSNGGLMQMTAEWGDIPPHWMVYFASADAEATARSVEQHGGKINVPAFDTPVGKIAVVGDPQGAIFSLIQLKQQPS